MTTVKVSVEFHIFRRHPQPPHHIKHSSSSSIFPPPPLSPVNQKNNITPSSRSVNSIFYFTSFITSSPHLSSCLSFLSNQVERHWYNWIRLCRLLLLHLPPFLSLSIYVFSHSLSIYLSVNHSPPLPSCVPITFQIFFSASFFFKSVTSSLSVIILSLSKSLTTLSLFFSLTLYMSPPFYSFIASLPPFVSLYLSTFPSSYPVTIPPSFSPSLPSVSACAWHPLSPSLLLLSSSHSPSDTHRSPPTKMSSQKPATHIHICTHKLHGQKLRTLLKRLPFRWPLLITSILAIF